MGPGIRASLLMSLMLVRGRQRAFTLALCCTSCHHGQPGKGADEWRQDPNRDSYTHRGCGTTVVSGDDYLMLEYPFRPVDSTFCSACRQFVVLDAVDWDDTGENVHGYRSRLAAAFSFGARVRYYMTGTDVSWSPPRLDGVYGDTTHFHRYERPATAAAQPVRQVQAAGVDIPGEVTALGQAEHTHEPRPLLQQMRSNPWLFAVAGLAVICLSVSLLFIGRPGRMIVAQRQAGLVE
jgi:hypothetical protein